MSDKNNKINIAIIGAGIFGITAALKLKENNFSVDIFEASSDILQGASYNNQNRLHLGFHYPRDSETVKQCAQGYEDFYNQFNSCVKTNFSNAYFISSENSLTSSKNYLEFCIKNELQFKKIDLNNFEPKIEHCDLGILTNELVYDASELRIFLKNELIKKNIQPQLNSKINSIKKNLNDFTLTHKNEKKQYDCIINTTYSNINQFDKLLGIDEVDYQFEYTMVPIIEWMDKPIGITIMDGPFMTILPFGKSKKSLLYHVTHSVVDSTISKKMPENWSNPSSSPSSFIDKKSLFDKMITSTEYFVSTIKHAKLLGYLEGPRIILPRLDATDTRPSIISEPIPGFISVFTGKVVHCTWVANEISKNLLKKYA